MKRGISACLVRKMFWEIPLECTLKLSPNTTKEIQVAGLESGHFFILEAVKAFLYLRFIEPVMCSLKIENILSQLKLLG